MRNISLFTCSDDAQEILDALLVSEIVGVSGGRVSVRALVKRVDQAATNEGVAIDQEDGYIVIGPTYNHDRAELAYMYDSRKVGEQEAMDAVIAAFEKAHPAD